METSNCLVIIIQQYQISITGITHYTLPPGAEELTLKLREKQRNLKANDGAIFSVPCSIHGSTAQPRYRPVSVLRMNDSHSLQERKTTLSREAWIK